MKKGACGWWTSRRSLPRRGPRRRTRLFAWQRATVESVRRLKSPKGNPLEIARIAGIAAAKRTAELIPLCHPLALTHVDVSAKLCQNGIEITSEATATGPTGVEMEASGGGVCCGTDDLRHVQSARTRHGNHGGVRGEEGGRAKRHVCASWEACEAMTPMKDVKVLVVDDNALILDLLMKGLLPHCDARAAADGADALLKIVDDPPDLVVCDYRMPGLDGRQLYEKLRGRQQTKAIPFIFLASRSDIEEKLRPIVEGVEEFIPKPFFLKDLVRRAKKVVDRLQLEKLQNRQVRPGVIQGRLEEMSIMDLMQSLEMGQKSCQLDDPPRRRKRRSLFCFGAMQGRAAGSAGRRSGRVSSGALAGGRI